MSDPVAEKSAFLRMYMSNHPDTLVAYAKWYGKVAEAVSSAEMTSITSKAMTLTCTLKGGSKKEVVIPLDPPLSGYEEVKPRLLEMKAIAQEKLGMIKAPQITSFNMPADTIQTGIFVSSLIYLTQFPRHSSSPLFVPAQFIHSLIGHVGGTILNITFYTVVVAHIFETAYTFYLCRKHRTGFLVGAAHVLATMFFGFPIWKDLRKRIQDARINSVMKVE